MNIEIQIQEIDYNTIAESLYPSLKQHVSSSNKFLSGLLEILGELPLKTLSVIPQGTKNKLTVFLIDHVKERLMKQLQKCLNDNDLSLDSGIPQIINCDNGIKIAINNLQITKQNNSENILA